MLVKDQDCFACGQGSHARGTRCGVGTGNNTHFKSGHSRLVQALRLRGRIRMNVAVGGVMRAFFAYPYKEDFEPFALGIKEFLLKQNWEVEDGKWPDATIDLDDDITEKIRECDVLVALLVEHHLSEWVNHEIKIAIGAGL